ncbi:hypothetical protein R80B4_00636 [Fibrobacteres bacterium R8-0-B4]
MATIEELEGMMAEVWAMMKENEEIRKRSAAEAEESRKRFDEELAESCRKDEESRRKDEESRRKSRSEVDAAIKALSKTVDHWVGRFGNTTGYITEMIIVPGIRMQMDKLGHKFDSLSARKEFYRKDGSAFAETDLLLENGKEVMVVEIKTHLTKDDVDYQVKRLKKLRSREEEVKIAGKSLISGVAGLSIDEDAKKMAGELGMYVIQVIESDKLIEVEAPANGVGRW